MNMRSVSSTKGTENNMINEKNCPICTSAHTEKIIDWSMYTINECKQCQVIYCHPMPSKELLNSFYQGFLYNIPNQRDIKKQIEKRKQELNSLLFTSDTTNKNFLDYGGGTGSAYAAAKELGLVAYYQDLDKEAEAFVIKEHGLTKSKIVNDINDSEVFFDYIFSDNVIEHLLDPIGYVKEMREALNKGGQIIVKTPHGKNTESFFYPVITIKGYLMQAKKYNSFSKSVSAYFRRFWHCDPPRHLYSFSEKNLRIIAEKAGFQHSEIDILYYNIPLLKYSFLLQFLDFRKYNNLKSILFRILIIPIIPFEILSKIIQVALLKIKVLTPGGIILKLHKNRGAQNK